MHSDIVRYYICNTMLLSPHKGVVCQITYKLRAYRVSIDRNLSAVVLSSLIGRLQIRCLLIDITPPERGPSTPVLVRKQQTFDINQ